MQYTYKIKKNAKEVGDVLVEKHGLCAVFSLRDLNREMRDAEKSIKELTANASLNNATMTNVLNNNDWIEPIIKKLDAKKLHAIQLYFTAKAKFDMYSDLAKQSKRALNTLKKEDKEVRAVVLKA